MAEKILKRLLTIILGLAWGAISFFWLGYSILTLGNFMEEPGSLDYVAEGESMRIFGLLGCILYFMVFVPILFFLYKRKHYLYSFLVSMLLCGIVLGLYIFVIRWQKGKFFENCANSLAYVPLLKYNKSTKKWDIVTFRRGI